MESVAASHLPRAQARTARVRSLAELATAPGPARTVTAFAALFVASTVAFADLAEDFVTGDPLVRWDARFALWLHERTTHSLLDLFGVVTYGGNAITLGLAVLVAAWLLVRARRRAEAVVLVAALAGAGIGNALLKLIFHRPRPEVAVLHLETYSFPSGHAAAAAATFTVGAYVLVRGRGQLARAGIALATVLAIAVVGFSRLYLGVHYLSDVLAGTCVGLAWASVCVIVLTLAEPQLARVVPRRLGARG